MKIPLSWLSKYVKLEHNPKEFSNIMTLLGFMPEGKVEEVNGESIFDFDTKSNRPDMLSIIGAAREYAAYIDKPVNYPEGLEEIPVDWNEPDKNLSVQAKDLTRRFCTVEIENVNVKESPEWIKKDLELYGIPSINNIVDITNYVMLEYGLPLHAFDRDKLAKDKNSSLLTIRRATDNETFETWQKTKIELSKEDLVVADAEKPVAIAGVIGGANSDIDKNTKNIILESAAYDQASIRRTSLRHNLRTDASTRHEKFLNPNMVEVAIKRALLLIADLAEGKILRIEDFYEKLEEPTIIEFNVFEIERLGGVQLTITDARFHLERLGFIVLEQKEAIGLDKSILTIRVPDWRTDIKLEADVVEEVLRLWGYDNIPLKPLMSAAPDFSTPEYLLLEEKIRDILVNMGLDEYITSPLVDYDEKNSDQILLENPLNKFQNALRTEIKPTLLEVVEFNKKAGRERIAVFEVGKIYYKKRVGEFLEERRIQALYSGYDFEIVKADFTALMTKLGIVNKLQWKETDKKLVYTINDLTIAKLSSTGYELFTENLLENVSVKEIPALSFQVGLTQRIVEEISLVVEAKEPLGRVAAIISSASDYIKEVQVKDIYEDAKLGTDKVSATFHVLFEDVENKLSRENIEEIKTDMLNMLKRVGAKLRT
jgi:phenylalanyl-tRNA synthetase beta chain